MQGLSSDLKQFFLVKNNLLTSVHNDAADYNRVIGIALLKAFRCAKNRSMGPDLIWPKMVYADYIDNLLCFSWQWQLQCDPDVSDGIIMLIIYVGHISKSSKW